MKPPKYWVDVWKAGRSEDMDLEAVFKACQAEARDAVFEVVERLHFDGECLPKCDSYGHEDLCPVVNLLAAAKADLLQQEGEDENG